MSSASCHFTGVIAGLTPAPIRFVAASTGCWPLRSSSQCPQSDATVCRAPCGVGHPGKPSARDVQPRDGAAPHLGARPLGRTDVTASGGTGRHGRALRLRGATHCGGAGNTSASGYDHPNAWRPHCTRGLQGAPRRLSRRALQATSEEQRKEHLRRYAGHVRGHVAKLAAKAYEEQFASAPAFTVLFIPGEAFFSATAEADPGLIEYAVESRILTATPVTLVALLQSVAYGWRQEKLAQSAREISSLGKQVYERASVLWNHLESLRGALTAAVNAFNKAVGSFETRLLPGIRRFRDVGATAAEPIPPLEVV